MTKKQTFQCIFTEYNGEQEYRNTKLVFAGDNAEAEKIIIEYLKDWYTDPDAEPIIDDTGKVEGYYFLGGSLAVRLKSIMPMSIQSFAREELRFGIIQDDERDRLNLDEAMMAPEVLDALNEAEVAFVVLNVVLTDIEKLSALAEHVVAMADDAYLVGHPEWNAIADEAKGLINTIHDIMGIWRYLDRTTGKLLEFFEPRFTQY